MRTNLKPLTATPTGAVCIARAKKFGKAHGYAGRIGGWIHGPSGVRVCQGWWDFYNRARVRIEDWGRLPRPGSPPISKSDLKREIQEREIEARYGGGPINEV